MFGKSIIFAWSSILTLSTATTPEAPEVAGPFGAAFGAALADLLEAMTTEDPKTAPGGTALRGSAEPTSGTIADGPVDFADRGGATGYNRGGASGYDCPEEAGDGVLRASSTCEAGKLKVFKSVRINGEWTNAYRNVPENGNTVQCQERSETNAIPWKCDGQDNDQKVSGGPVDMAWVKYSDSTICWYW